MAKEIVGSVIKSSKDGRTAYVVKVVRFAHPLYGKIVVRHNVYCVETNGVSYRNGESVVIVETRPISKTKRWIVKRSFVN